MNRIIVFLFLIVSLGVTAQESEKYFWEGYKYQAKGKLSKATESYFKAVKASDGKSNITSRELYYLTFAHGEIAKIYSGVNEFSNKPENILLAYNSVKSIYENYAILKYRGDENYIRDFERAKILTIAKESLSNIYNLNSSLVFPKKTNDNKVKPGIEFIMDGEYLKIKKINKSNDKSIQNDIKEDDIVLEITDTNGISYYCLLGIKLNEIEALFYQNDNANFRMKIMRNGETKYTQIKNYFIDDKPKVPQMPDQFSIDDKNTESKENELTTPKPIINEEKNIENKEQVVALTVTGTGKTKEDAQKNALRSAIEQAFGAFVSSKTEILNDSIVKDEVVSITNGNIQKYDVISEGVLQNGSYVSTVNAVISITKLTSFAESKGAQAEFKGALFAMDMKLQKLNEANEFIAISNLCEISDKLLSKALDFEIAVSDPKLNDNNSELYYLNIEITLNTNSNYNLFIDNFWKSIEGICMSNNEINYYNRINKGFFVIEDIKDFQKPDHNGYPYRMNTSKTYGLRNKESLVLLYDFLKNTNRHLFNASISGESRLIELSEFISREYCEERDFNEHCKMMKGLSGDSIINKYNVLVETELMNNNCRQYIECPVCSAGGNIIENELFVGSFPNAVFDYVEELNGNNYNRYTSFYKRYLNDAMISNSKKLPKEYQDNIKKYRQPDESSEWQNKLRSEYPRFKILVTRRKEICPYKLKIIRTLSLDELQKITEYKIVKK